MKNKIEDIIDRTDFYYENEIALYKGVPYTGLTYTRYENNGELKSIYPYENGLIDGICRDWYENGQIESERIMKKGCSNGYEKCWYPNGILKSISSYKSGGIIYYKKWDEKGNLVEYHSYSEFTDTDFNKI